MQIKYIIKTKVSFFNLDGPYIASITNSAIGLKIEVRVRQNLDVDRFIFGTLSDEVFSALKAKNSELQKWIENWAIGDIINGGFSPDRVSAILKVLSDMSVLTKEQADDIQSFITDPVTHNNTHNHNDKKENAKGNIEYNSPVSTVIDETSIIASSNLTKFILTLSPYVQRDVNSYIRNKPLSTTIAELKLCPNEKDLFAEFVDSVTNEYIKIPLSIHDQFHDIYTILNFENECPHTRMKFHPYEIGSGKGLMKKLPDAINKLNQQRIREIEESKNSQPQPPGDKNAQNIKSKSFNAESNKPSTAKFFGIPGGPDSADLTNVSSTEENKNSPTN